MTQQESARVQVEEVVRRIVAGFSPDRIVVFGSHALVGVDMPTDVIVATPDEVARLQGVPGSIIKPALEEGRVVYERPA